MTHEDAQEMREEGGFCPSCGEHKERGRECLCCGWVKAPPDYAVKCDVVEVEASTYIGYANMAAEAERWWKEAKRMRPVYEAAMAFYNDQAMHWRPTTDKAWDKLERACARAAREAEEE